MAILPFVNAVDKTCSKITSLNFESILREFVSLNAVGNALSQCSKVFGVTHIVLLLRNKCSV